jgi:hypothetical protein
VTEFGLLDDDARATFDRQVVRAERILAEMRELMRVTPLDDPEAWPVYGSLISDAQRAVRELDSARARAVLPTDGGSPIRAPRPSLIRGRIRVARSTLGARSPADPRAEERTRATRGKGHTPKLRRRLPEHHRSLAALYCARTGFSRFQVATRTTTRAPFPLKA